PTGRRRRVPPPEEAPQRAPAAAEPHASGPEPHAPAAQHAQHAQHSGHTRHPEHGGTEGAGGAEQAAQADLTVVAASPILGGSVPPEEAPRQRALPMPGSETAPSEQTSGVSVRTLGQGVPFARQAGEQHTGQHAVQPPAPPAPPAPQPPAQ
ncbi:hypothetical protein ACLIYP_30855, partial [Streptomyces nanhaiensis]